MGDVIDTRSVSEKLRAIADTAERRPLSVSSDMMAIFREAADELGARVSHANACAAATDRALAERDALRKRVAELERGEKILEHISEMVDDHYPGQSAALSVRDGIIKMREEALSSSEARRDARRQARRDALIEAAEQFETPLPAHFVEWRDQLTQLRKDTAGQLRRMAEREPK